jgi:L-asparagine oxygenase
MKEIILNQSDNALADQLLAELSSVYSGPCDPAFIAHARSYACRLPQHLLTAVDEFRNGEGEDAVLLLRGFEVDDTAIGPTPSITGRETDENSAPREGFMLMLMISYIGEAFGWSSQRNGALINNILPVKMHEHEQLSTGSLSNLDWHTEEAFHPFRADYLALMCLRNHDKIPTQLATINEVHISEQSKKILFQPRFIFLADKNFENDPRENTPVPVMFGSYGSPYVRLDPSFMQPLPGDNEAAAALAEIVAAFGNCLHDVLLEPGDIALVDNYRAVHGRKGFQPRFDGKDRWLKRVNITLDLRKSRALRHNDSRVIAAI